MLNKTVLIDLKTFPMFKGYVFIFSIRYFWFSYTKHIKMGFKNLKYGNIFFIFLLPFKAFIDVWKLVNIHILRNLVTPHNMYEILSNS